MTALTVLIAVERYGVARGSADMRVGGDMAQLVTAAAPERPAVTHGAAGMNARGHHD